MSGLIETFRVMLRRSPEIRSGTFVGEHGVPGDAVWNDEIDMAAVTLWRLAHGSPCRPNGAARTQRLDARCGGRGAARSPTTSRGAKPIPRVVALAMRALELAQHCTAPIHSL